MMGRHLARAMEAIILSEALERWLSALDPGGPVAVPLEIPDRGKGEGLAEAPDGRWAIGAASRPAASPTTKW
ncbi:MAG: hypothetical protein ACUVQS_05930 [Candidatus Bipolaricaulaceae bacterium]